MKESAGEVLILSSRTATPIKDAQCLMVQVNLVNHVCFSVRSACPSSTECGWQNAIERTKNHTSVCKSSETVQSEVFIRSICNLHGEHNKMRSEAFIGMQGHAGHQRLRAGLRKRIKAPKC
ncbi:unnamed protein product [Urochloa humidicola]